MSMHEIILQQLGYRVESVLGEGGEAFVYRALHPRIGLCAVKVTKKAFRDADDLPEEVRNSLNAAIELKDDPVVVTLHDWFVKSHLITVWQLAHSSLEKMISERRSAGAGLLPRDTCCRILMNVATGLDRLHHRLQPVIHCDIKPANLLIFAEDFVKIGDLGLAQLQTSATGCNSAGRSTEYSHSRHEGVPTKARDVFAFAITYAELRLGRHPYGASKAEIDWKLEANRPQWDELDLDERDLLERAVTNEGSIDSLVEWLKQLQPRDRSLGADPRQQPISRQDKLRDGLAVRTTASTETAPKDVNQEAKRLIHEFQFAEARELLEILPEHLRDGQLYRTALDLSEKVRVLQTRYRLAERNGHVALAEQYRQQLQVIRSSQSGFVDNPNGSVE